MCWILGYSNSNEYTLGSQPHKQTQKEKSHEEKSIWFGGVPSSTNRTFRDLWIYKFVNKTSSTINIRYFKINAEICSSHSCWETFGGGDILFSLERELIHGFSRPFVLCGANSHQIDVKDDAGPISMVTTHIFPESECEIEGVIWYGLSLW